MAQITATIVGTASDPSVAVVANANIPITNQNTGGPAIDFLAVIE